MKVLWFLGLLLAIGWIILISQLFRIQIIEGAEYSRRAAQNRFRVSPIEADRGIIYDNSGRPLVEDSEGLRSYLYPEAFSHILGYTGEADPKELTLFGVDLGSKVGKLGLEREEDGVLRGVDGGRLEEYSATGEKIRSISQKNPVPGRHLQLTMNASLQQYAYDLLKESKHYGAIILSTVDSQMIALASYPAYDPNIFILASNGDVEAQKELDVLLKDTRYPMFHRAIAGVYPPASTFKIITSLGALEEGKIKVNTRYTDTGEVRIGEFRYGNWYYDQYGKTEGNINIIRALARSNDTFFYLVGRELGIDHLSSWAKTFGLGSKTGIHINGEVAGLVPYPEWKEKERGEDWYLGDTLITSIGQGNLQTTPLQVHQMMAQVANRGHMCEPKLVAHVVDSAPQPLNILDRVKIDACKPQNLQPSSLQIVTEGLKQACEPGGTAWPLFEFKVKSEKLKVKVDNINFIKQASGSADLIKIPIACKTGTAETGKMVYDEKGKKKYLNHAWLTAFAPVEKPEVVVTVLLEEAGQGSDMAGPIAKKVLEKWFEEN